MKTKKRYYFSKLFLCIIFPQGFATAQEINTTSLTNSLNGESTESQIPEQDLIHFGDLIEVDVVGSTEYDWRGTLTSEGFLDGIGFSDEPIYSLCRSEEEVSSKITESYGRFLRNPKILVKILDRSNRPSSIISGAVKTSQRLHIKRPIFLNELIIISGGLTDRASGEIQIFRPQNLNCLAEVEKKNKTVNLDVETRERYVAAREDNGTQFINIKISDLLNGKEDSNPQILSGDIINILEAPPIYVIGGVEYPKQISFRQQITLTRAIASAGGLSKDSDETKITIFRRDEKETRAISVDLKKIKSNGAEDIMLQALDIVDVARRGEEENKIPPILENVDSINKDRLKLPLRAID